MWLITGALAASSFSSISITSGSAIHALLSCLAWFLSMLSLLCVSCPPLTGPECYVRPHVVTNKKLIRNALIFVSGWKGQRNHNWNREHYSCETIHTLCSLSILTYTLSPSPLRSWTHLGLVTSWYSSITHLAVSLKLSMAISRKMTKWDTNAEREGGRGEEGRERGRELVCYK